MMKKALTALLLAVVSILCAAQESTIPLMYEIQHTTCNGEKISVLDARQDDTHNYYLCAGHLGIGDEVIQVMFDPVSVLFIPLGHTVTEALATMQKIQALFDEPVDTSIEVPGCLSAVFPNDEFETVRITLRKPLLSTLLEFSVQRDEYIRATHIPKSQFNSLVGGIKFYGKLYPNN